VVTVAMTVQKEALVAMTVQKEALVAMTDQKEVLVAMTDQKENLVTMSLNPNAKEVPMATTKQSRKEALKAETLNPRNVLVATISNLKVKENLIKTVQKLDSKKVLRKEANFF